MKTILLSIIVPAYNMENYLERSLSSLLVDESLMQRFEVLVINDGSKDRTSKIAHDFEAKYPDTFRVIDKENGHYGSCVNRGLAEAKGTFVKVLDADDAFDKHSFSAFLHFLSKEDVQNNADAILSDFVEVNIMTGCRKIKHFSDHDRFFFISDLTHGDRYEWFIHGLTYKTELLHRIDYRQSTGIAYTDHEWSFIPMAHVEKMIRFNGPLYLYMTGREDQSVNDIVHAKNLWMEVDVIELLLDCFFSMSESIDDQHLTFLSERLYLMVTHIYQLYLITFNHLGLSKERLEHFDKKIKGTNPELWAAIDNYRTRIGGVIFHPIKNWRRRRYALMKIQSSFYYIADSIAKIKKCFSGLFTTHCSVTIFM